MGSKFDKSFGAHSKAVQHAVAGGVIGVGEVILQPLDVLKIRRQTNPASAWKGGMSVFWKEGLSLYRGATWTMSRNLAGSSALFGSACLVKDKFFRLKNHNDATFAQILIASTTGALACITVASPMDVVKTRIQKQPFEDPLTGSSIVKSMIKNEGIGSFCKGLVPKALVLGPKLIFAFSVTQYMSMVIDGMVRAEKNRDKREERDENLRWKWY